MNLCTPTMTITFWIVIALTAIAGFWLIWKRYDVEKKHGIWLEEAEKQLVSYCKQKDLEMNLVRTEYEKARVDYLGVIKEMKSEEIPDPNQPESYYPKR